jgi:hypothetical protein
MRDEGNGAFLGRTIDRRKPKYSEKTCPKAATSAINPIYTDLELNPGNRSEKPTIGYLS